PATTICLKPASPTPWASTRPHPTTKPTPSGISTRTFIRRCCVQPRCGNSWSASKCWECPSATSRPKAQQNGCEPSPQSISSIAGNSLPRSTGAPQNSTSGLRRSRVRLDGQSRPVLSRSARTPPASCASQSPPAGPGSPKPYYSAHKCRHEYRIPADLLAELRAAGVHSAGSSATRTHGPAHTRAAPARFHQRGSSWKDNESSDASPPGPQNIPGNKCRSDSAFHRPARYCVPRCDLLPTPETDAA